jgi:pSer/pThr/pTyr-binding forkhead associated (FHA) protein
MSGVLMLALRVIMAVCLYAFIGLVIYITWKDLRQQSTLASRKNIPSLFLINEEAGKELTFSIQKSEGSIGRDQSCDIHFEENTLSARHARVSYHHNQWWAEDLNSTNGTWLNDHPLLQPSVIDTGDRLTCGKVDFTIKIKPVE